MIFNKIALSMEDMMADFFGHNTLVLFHLWWSENIV